LIRGNNTRYPEDMMRLLGITAHPDDEVGAFGGSLLLYSTRGVETYVICLTAGEAATNKGEAGSREELAAIRRGEFAASCKILQVKQAQVLDYPDGGLTRVDPETVVGELSRWIRSIKPHLILTMGPEGAITGHLDHAMAAIFATMAFHWAARRDRYPEQFKDGLEPHRTQKLYYCTSPIVLPERQPVSPPPYTATLDVAAFLETKIKASQAHATQKPLMDLFGKTLRKFGSREFFHLAATNKMQSSEQETDLLTGISE
jgi:LmbE family N-acetylglucosaminyl deacetylase